MHIIYGGGNLCEKVQKKLLFHFFANLNCFTGTRFEMTGKRADNESSIASGLIGYDRDLVEATA